MEAVACLELLQNVLLVVFAGIWLGICKQLAQHVGAVLCLLDLPLHRSNIGWLGLPCALSSPTFQKEDQEGLNMSLCFWST